MGDVTRLLERIDSGDEQALEEFVTVVHGELRKIATAKLSREQRATWQVTELINEAYLRLADGEGSPLPFHSRAHFFAAAAEAMRRILVDHARRKASAKRGGGQPPLQLDESLAVDHRHSEEIVAIHEALASLEQHDAQAAQLVKLRYFVGMPHKEAAEAMGISKRVADRLWVVSKAWLYQQLNDS